jgi:GTP-binding protein Era
LEDADVLLFISEIYEHPEQLEDILASLKAVDAKKLLLLNKVDQAKGERVTELTEAWLATGMFEQVIPISALENLGIDEVRKYIVANLPESPPYYPKDELTDRPERFFVSEIIRGKIFTNYSKEIPYCTEVIIDSFKDEPDITRISAVIFVERQSQKPIVIGKGGDKLKKVGTESRLEMEAFLGRKVFLELFVKVKENWRNDPRILKGLGYDQSK